MVTPETGKTNAMKFVSLVASKARDGRVIVIHCAEPRGGVKWPWMRNPAWQNYVLDQLEHRAKVRNAEFHPGDNVDTLCFSAISTAGDSNIERLGLQETLDGVTPPAGFFARIKWHFMMAFPGGLT